MSQSWRHEHRGAYTEGRAKLSAVVTARWIRWREERQLQQVAKGSDATAKLARQVVRIVGRRVIQRMVDAPCPSPHSYPQPYPAHDLDFEVGAHPFVTGRFQDDDGPLREPSVPPPSPAPKQEGQEPPNFRTLESGVAIDEPDDDYWKG